MNSTSCDGVAQSLSRDSKVCRGVDLESLPEALKGWHQWVVWKRVERDGKETKVPYSARSGKPAKVTEPSTWSSFEEVLVALESGRWAGLGFVFTENDPYAGVDLDKVIDPGTGDIEAWAQEVIDELDSYTEVSQSGTGVHVIIEGKKPGERKRQGQVEIYDDVRFFALTGRLWPGTRPTIEQRQQQLEELHARVFGVVRAAPTGEAPAGELRLDPDAEPPLHKLVVLLEGKKFTDTWNHSRKELGSTSEFDFALARMVVDAGWSDQEIADLIIAFRRKHMKAPDKALRADYIEGTIRNARDRGRALDLLPFTLVRVIQFGTEDAVYEFVIEKDGQHQRIEVGTVEVLCSFRRTRVELFQAGYVLPPSLSKQWHNVLEAILQITTVEETETDMELWRDFVMECVNSQGPFIVIDPDHPRMPSSLPEAFAGGFTTGICDLQGRLYLRLERLLAPALLRMGQGLTTKSIARRLRQLGFEKLKSVSVPGQSRRRRINLWVSPEGLMSDVVREWREENAAEGGTDQA